MISILFLTYISLVLPHADCLVNSLVEYLGSCTETALTDERPESSLVLLHADCLVEYLCSCTEKALTDERLAITVRVDMEERLDASN